MPMVAMEPQYDCNVCGHRWFGPKVAKPLCPQCKNEDVSVS